MQRNFERSLSAVLQHEGGYVDHPSDPGGATNMGITRRTLANWLKVAPSTSLPKSAVQNMTRETAAAIYKAKYWDLVRGDELPDGVDYAVFDFGVNSGPNRAVSFLQRVVGADEDGIVGPETMKRVLARDRDSVIRDLCAARMKFLEGLSTFPTFGKGWTRRVSGVRQLALQMAAQTTSAPSTGHLGPTDGIPTMPPDWEPPEAEIDVKPQNDRAPAKHSVSPWHWIVPLLLFAAVCIFLIIANLRNGGAS